MSGDGRRRSGEAGRNLYQQRRGMETGEASASDETIAGCCSPTRRGAHQVAWRSDAMTRLWRGACGQLLSVGFDGAAAPAELLARIAAGEVGGVMLFRPNIAIAGAGGGAGGGAAGRGARRRAAGGLGRSGGGPGAAGARARRPSGRHAVGGRRRRSGADRRRWGGRWAGSWRRWASAGTSRPCWTCTPTPPTRSSATAPSAATPAAVTAHALAFWRGLRAAGVLGCGKHFPGHGDTHTDSHHELPVVAHDAERLRARRAGAVRGGRARRGWRRS